MSEDQNEVNGKLYYYTKCINVSTARRDLIVPRICLEVRVLFPLLYYYLAERCTIPTAYYYLAERCTIPTALLLFS